MNIEIPQNLSNQEIEIFINNHLNSQKCEIIGMTDKTGTVILSIKASNSHHRVKVVEASNIVNKEIQTKYKKIHMAPMTYEILQEKLSAST